LKNGEFRKDLFFRLNVLPIRIPPLRERAEDILLLADFFLKKNCKKLKKNLSFHPQTLETMLSYPWSGKCPRIGKTPLSEPVYFSEDQELMPETLIYRYRG
jgi:transcriptional regulator with GAF, ATPase, and Fis domain